MDKDVIFRYIVQKNEIMSFAATWKDPEFIIESEVRQRKTKMIWYHFYVEFFKVIQMNLFTRPKKTHRHRKQTYGYQRRTGGRDKLGAWN